MEAEEQWREERRKTNWWPFIFTAAIQLVALGVVYGRIDQRVATLEQLRLEAKSEMTTQLTILDAKVQRLLERR